MNFVKSSLTSIILPANQFFICTHKFLPSFVTINVPLFKKLRDIIFFGGENHFMSHFEGHFEGAKTFLTPTFSLAALGTIYGVKKVLAPSKCPSKCLIKLLSNKKKNFVQQFLKQRDINSFFLCDREDLKVFRNIAAILYFKYSRQWAKLKIVG